MKFKNSKNAKGENNSNESEIAHISCSLVETTAKLTKY